MYGPGRKKSDFNRAEAFFARPGKKEKRFQPYGSAFRTAWEERKALSTVRKRFLYGLGRKMDETAGFYGRAEKRSGKGKKKLDRNEKLVYTNHIS